MFETQDMAFASYLVGRGHKLKSVTRSGRKVAWVFELSDEDLSKEESAWPSSEECRFFNVYQTLRNQTRNRSSDRGA